MTPKESYNVSSKLIKELQRLVAIVVVEKLHMQSSMQSAKQFEYCYNEYHGSSEKDTIGISELFLQGASPFQEAFDESIVEVTDKDATTNKELTLKKLLSRAPDLSLCVSAHLTTHLMMHVSKSKYSAKLAGRQIQTFGNAAKTNVLKATAFADVYSKGNHGCANPSGHNSSDLYHHVLDKMYDFECGRTPEEKMGDNVGVEDQEEEENGETTSNSNNQSASKTLTNKNSESKNKRPVDWFFHGFMTFVLFSKYALDQNNCLSMLKGSNFGKGGAGSGRVSLRNGNKASRNKLRSLQAGQASDNNTEQQPDSPFKRGISLESRQQLAMLNQNKKR